MWEHVPWPVCGGQRASCENPFSTFYLPGDWTLTLRAGSRHLYPLSHLPGPITYHFVYVLPMCYTTVYYHPFNPNTQAQKQSYLYEFEASLVYIVSFRQARATQWDQSKRKILCVCTSWHTCRSQKTTFRIPFAPSTMWIPVIKLRFSILVASAFSQWVMLLAHQFIPESKELFLQDPQLLRWTAFWTVLALGILYTPKDDESLLFSISFKCLHRSNTHKHTHTYGVESSRLSKILLEWMHCVYVVCGGGKSMISIN